MKSSATRMFALLAAIFIIEGNWVRAAPSPDNDKLLRTLENLDKLYSSMARPSVRSGPATQPNMGPKVQRAINMLRIQHLEHLYGDRARPRFGKRTEADDATINFPAETYESQRLYVSPILQRALQQSFQNWNPATKWGYERVAPENDVRYESPYQSDNVISS
ncbi:PREDICTED: uncharacterized protein LOC108557363 [Nicrophorus vespilloides]|uniref:Uncharacterized protein LOC108557363 n=1 Tax=Nicrophorus vespilloides TaxID=110193 RepID=A0ABM1M437_NICVS|nr:PREDICTED: uncharacterized protein LOC108557363 [Nicrophorus vespilloides]